MHKKFNHLSFREFHTKATALAQSSGMAIFRVRFEVTFVDVDLEDDFERVSFLGFTMLWERYCLDKIELGDLESRADFKASELFRRTLAYFRKGRSCPIWP